MRIPLPFGGLNVGTARADQPLGTSSDVANVLPIDQRTGRNAIAQRAGHSKYCGTVTGAAKAKAIISLPDASGNITYASLGSSVTTDWSKRSESVVGVATDRQGNVYALSGKTTITKRNSSGATVWTLTLPVADPLHEVRALHVDRFDRVYAGVSTGGLQSSARVWSYAQDTDSTPRQVWQMELGEYVESIETSNDALFLGTNKVDSGQAYVRGFTNFDSPNPTEQFVRRGPYPLNQIAVSPKDGALFVAAEPNSTRGFNPKSPDTSAQSQDWTPLNLDSYQKRIRSWYDASDPDSLLILRDTGAQTDEGGEVRIWYDRSGKGRHWYADATGLGTHTGPTLRTEGVGGLPSLHFNGSSNSMITVVPVSTDKASRAECLTALPVHAGAQYVVAMVCRIAFSSANPHYVLMQGTRGIVANSTPGTLAGTTSEGAVKVHETGGIASTPGAADTPNATAPAGNATTPLGGCIGPGGLCVITWVCDGGVHDVFGSATRSNFRVNGMPCDRWQSASFTSAVATTLGYSATAGAVPFAGDICEIIVLEDWYDANDARQRLITRSDGNQPLATQYPDSAFSFSSTVTDDLQQLEGYLAHKWGLGHLLPGGQAVWLVDQSGGSLDNGNTITIDAVTYTARAAGGLAAANDFLGVGVSMEIAFRNLRRAINGEGAPGTDYYYSTVPHTTVRALGPIGYQNSSPPRMALLLRSINAYASAFNVSKTEAATQTLAWANNALTAAATATTSTTSASSFPSGAVALAKNTNWYPHQYFIEKTTSLTLGGPPRTTDALTSQSSAGLFVTSKYGLVAKLDPANGRVRWVATSNYNNGGLGIGGVGYGVIVNSLGDVYCTGPRQALVTAPSIAADAIDVRKIIDNGSTFSTTLGTTDTTAWQDDPGEQTYHYPRMAIDKFDNLYVPIHRSSAGTSLAVYARLGTTLAGSDNANELATVTNITDTPRGYCVAVHPIVPEYPASFTDDRAQFVYLGSEQTSGSIAIYKLGLVSQTNAAGSPRSVVRLVVNGADIKTFTSGGTVTTVGSGSLDASAIYVDTFIGYRKAFFVDGRKPFYYDATTSTVSEWTATSGGEVLPRARLGCFWRGRAFLARGDNPSQWACSAVGDPFDWDFFPGVFTFSSAVSGTTALAGQPSDVVNSLFPINDDLLLIGGQHSIRRFTGDPANPTSQIQLVTDSVGTSFGPCWARDTEGVVYFFGSDANVYAMSPGGVPVSISADIHEQLRTIDFASYYVRLVYDTRWKLLHVLVEPYGAGGATVVTHYSWYKPGKSWWPRSWAAAGTQFTCAHVLDGDTAAERVILYGCEDGYVRKEDVSTKTDDGVRIETRALIGPIVPEEEEYEARTTAMQVVLDAEADGCHYQLYASSIPNRPTTPLVTGDLRGGFNNVPARMCGSYIWVLLRNASVGAAASATRWAAESLHLDVTKAGRKRNAPVR